MNLLSQSNLNPMQMTRCGMALKAAAFANQIWQRSILSSIPAIRENQVVYTAVRPATALATKAASFLGAAPADSLLTASVNAIMSVQAMKNIAYVLSMESLISKREFIEEISMNLVNAAGGMLFGVQALGYPVLLDEGAFNSLAMQAEENEKQKVLADKEEMQRRIQEEGQKRLTGMRQKMEQEKKQDQEWRTQLKKEDGEWKEESKWVEEEREARLKIGSEKRKLWIDESNRRMEAGIDRANQDLAEWSKLWDSESRSRVEEAGRRASERWQKRIESQFNAFAGLPFGWDSDCPSINPADYVNDTDVERAVRLKDRSKCGKHAEVILGPQGRFDREAYDKEGCGYVKTLAKKMFLSTHPDHNQNSPESAKAIQVVKEAAEALCPSLRKK